VYAATYPKGQMLSAGPKGVDKPWWQPW